VGFARAPVAGGRGGYIAAKQGVGIVCLLATKTYWTSSKYSERRPVRAIFSALPVTVYLTVSDQQALEKSFKFNDISLQKII
jgi:hypothetical protein